MSEWRRVEDILEYLLHEYEDYREIAEARARRRGGRYEPTMPEIMLVEKIREILSKIKSSKFDEIDAMLR